jgi:hypothetical protein
VAKAIKSALTVLESPMVSPKPESLTGEVPDADADARISLQTPSRNQYASAPRMSNEQDQMHVLIADDNNINTKVFCSCVFHLTSILFVVC